MEIRLQKWLADAGVASRRKAEGWITAGRVTVNGLPVTALGAKADTERDMVALDGKPLTLQPVPVYIMLHKPESVVTTVSDPQDRAVVMDYIPDIGVRVFPVGRLDYDTSGLLLLTNDGLLANALTHPRHAVEKIYIARLQGLPSKAALQAFRAGLLIEGRRTAPSGITVIKEASCTVRITLLEGRNRQIRKMCEAIGHPVVSLKRVAVGPVALGDLPKGQWRYLTEEEAATLKTAAMP